MTSNPRKKRRQERVFEVQPRCQSGILRTLPLGKPAILAIPSLGGGSMSPFEQSNPDAKGQLSLPTGIRIGTAELAESRLRHNSYLALRNICCDYGKGVLTLRGCLPTYYLKQVAQEVVAQMEGVEEIVNQIEIMSGP
jgi:hypothetical protein